MLVKNQKLYSGFHIDRRLSSVSTFAWVKVNFICHFYQKYRASRNELTKRNSVDPSRPKSTRCYQEAIYKLTTVVLIRWTIVFLVNICGKVSAFLSAMAIVALAFVVNPFEAGFDELRKSFKHNGRQWTNIRLVFIAQKIIFVTWKRPFAKVAYIEGICWLTTLFIYSLYRTVLSYSVRYFIR